MTLTQRLTELTVAIATSIREVSGRIGNLNDLTAAPRSSIVAALNQLRADMAELEAGTGGGGGTEIDDAVVAATTTWSSQKISTHVDAAILALVDGAPDALNTLKELADAISGSGDLQPILDALAVRLRVDEAQGLTAPQQQTGRDNLNVFSRDEIGTPDTDFVATFTLVLEGSGDS